jgi:hypothetical protein
MPIVNGTEIDIQPVSPDETKIAILNNSKSEDKLHVIAVISNPCQYARRYILAREFIKRMEHEADIILYVVELAYGDKEFHITDKTNNRHLQLRGSAPLWHKENLINLGVRKLLPDTWKAFAWIDADIEFDSASWASDALKVLNGHKDVIQLYSHVIDMNKNKAAISIFPSFGFQYIKGSKFDGSGINMWNPGFAWAMTRTLYNELGGLYEFNILGAGDLKMALSFITNSLKSLNENTTKDYMKYLLDFQSKATNLRLGYIPGVIRHYYHGSRKDRQYGERWKVLVKHNYSASKHITKNNDGLLIPSPQCPKALLEDILTYFSQRNEDEGL